MSNVVSLNAASATNAIKARADEIIATGENTIKKMASGKTDMFRVNPYLIHVKPDHNAREMNSPENLEHIDTLAQSIAFEGVKVALTLFRENDEYFVTDGHCRLAATIRAIEVYGADIATVPVVLENRGSNEIDRIFAQITYNSGRQFTTFEQGKVFKRLIAMGMSESEIAKRMGKSVTHVSQCLTVQEAPKEIRDSIVSGELSHTLAAQTIRDHGATAAAELLSEAVRASRAGGKNKATAKDVKAVTESRKTPEKTRERASMKAVREFFETNANEIVEVQNGDSEGRFIPEDLYLALRSMVGF